MAYIFLAWHPTCHYCGNNRMELAEKFLETVNDKDYQSPILFYVWGHSYQLDAYNDWDGLERFLKLISGHKEIWYASNIEICSYIKAAHSLIYSSSGDYIMNPSYQDVWMQIDNRPICIPSGKNVSVHWKIS